MQLFAAIQNAIIKNKERNAFLINSSTYTYLAFAEAISRIRNAIAINTAEPEKVIGLIANDDIETYAAIIALWLEGKAYVPLSPETPKDRNKNIIEQAFLQTIIDSSDEPILPGYNLISSKNLAPASINLIPKSTSEAELVYILFTSGTTGQPKGVPITRANLAGFITAFNAFKFEIDHNDRFLQMFELTFDLSVMSYLVPILNGACTYTIPRDAIKYSYIYELMEDQKLTVALMVPSILQYLRPYFKDINLPLMRYSLFCGEALSLDIAEEWSKCLPNAKILNVYGPTEDTIFCTNFTYDKSVKNKSYNGLLSIGKAMKGSMTIIVDDNDHILPPHSLGQLCLAGIQLTPGYWNNPEKNKEVFFIANYNGKAERFYKTGDLCKCDEEGDILYVGRLDFQVKVQGFRVELSEIEFHVKSFLQTINVVATAYGDAIGNTEIGLAIEAADFDTIPLKNYMKTQMPAYMVPKVIIFQNSFPLNANGKTDRNKLTLLFKNTRQ